MAVVVGTNGVSRAAAAKSVADSVAASIQIYQE